MSAQRQIEDNYVSEAEYFKLLERSETKLEWVAGEIRAMAGAMPVHVRIATRLAAAINSRLPDDSTCEAVTSDQKVRVEEADANYLPDVVFYCDDATFDANRPDWLLTPLLLAEVVSPSSERIDREEKLLNYRLIPSLRHYLLVSQRRVFVEHYHRAEGGPWISDIYNWKRDEIFIDFLDISIPVSEIYRRLNVPEGMISVQEVEETPETD